MKFFKIILTVLNFVVLAAHFFRGGHVLFAVVSIGLPFFLLLQNETTQKILRIASYITAGFWLETMLALVEKRVELGQPWIRMACILSFVALLNIVVGLLHEKKTPKLLNQTVSQTPVL